MVPIGHAHVLSALSRGLPPVTLLRGPRSVGKWTLAQHLAALHTPSGADVLACPPKLSVATVREIIAFVSVAGFGPHRCVLIDLDGASEAAQSALLKTLENPPGAARFILTSTGDTLATIVSRATVFAMGTLSAAQLRPILLALGMGDKEAIAAAAAGRGQVDTAVSVGSSDAARTSVLTMMRGLATGDRDLFDRSFAAFDDNTRLLLICWLREAITGQWVLFTEADTYGLHTDQARLRAMLVALSLHPFARARLGVRAALEPHLSPPTPAAA